MRKTAAHHAPAVLSREDGASAPQGFRAIAATLMMGVLFLTSPTFAEEGGACGRLEADMTRVLSDLERFGVSGSVMVIETRELGRIAASAGLASHAPERKMTRDRAFQIGSQTKLFTAAAIVKLAKEGQLKLDDRISNYVDGVEGGDKVTIRQLLTHTSGLGDGVRPLDVPSPPPNRPVSFEFIAELSELQGPDFAPGESWRYNNFGYDILGKIIEKASGESVSSYLRRSFFVPAGMDHTLVGSSDDWSGANMAHGYWTSRGALEDMGAPRDLTWAATAGDMISTADEMVDFVRALETGSPALGVTFDDLTAKAVPVPGAPEMPRYGYGVMERTFGGRIVLGHGGFIQGYISYSGVEPESGVAFSVMTALNGDPETNYEKLMERLSGAVQQILSTAIFAGVVKTEAGLQIDCAKESE